MRTLQKILGVQSFTSAICTIILLLYLYRNRISSFRALIRTVTDQGTPVPFSGSRAAKKITASLQILKTYHSTNAHRAKQSRTRHPAVLTAVNLKQSTTPEMRHTTGSREIINTSTMILKLCMIVLIVVQQVTIDRWTTPRTIYDACTHLSQGATDKGHTYRAVQQCNVATVDSTHYSTGHVPSRAPSFAPSTRRTWRGQSPPPPLRIALKIVVQTCNTDTNSTGSQTSTMWPFKVTRHLRW